MEIGFRFRSELLGSSLSRSPPLDWPVSVVLLVRRRMFQAFTQLNSRPLDAIIANDVSPKSILKAVNPPLTFYLQLTRRMTCSRRWHLGLLRLAECYLFALIS